MGKLRIVLQEPLLHFFLIGAFFFILFQWQTDKRDNNTNREIIVTNAHIRSLTDNFTRVWQRNPTDKEIDGLIKDYIQEEILYREAIALGLDKNDTVIRRRLRQKMEFLSEGIIRNVAPTESDLRDFFSQNPELFKTDEKLSFLQVYLRTDKSKDDLDQEVITLLSQLEGDHIDVREYGDPSLLEPRYDSVTYSLIEREFGKQFADELQKLSIGEWYGPIDSGYGTHLVYIQEKVDGRLPKFEETKDEVVREWSETNRQRVKQTMSEELLKSYHIEIEKE